MTALAIIVIAAVAFGSWRLSLHRHPYAPCRWCKGHGGQNRGSTAKRWGNCGRCGGSGRRVRFGARP